MAVGTAVLEFASDESLARPVVSALYHAAESASAEPTHRYRISRGPAGWLALAPGAPRFGPAALEDVFAFLEWRATEDLLANAGAVFLHAAGLCISGRAVVLVGPSGSGKSSLAAHLLSRGHLAWGDDLLRFAPSEGLFSAVPRSWKLDAKTLESLNIVSRLHADGALGMLFASTVLYMSPAAFRRHWQAPAASANVLVLLDTARHHGRPTLERTSEGEAAVLAASMLLGASVGRQQGDAIMASVLQAMHGITAYRAAGSPPAALADALERELAA